MSAPANGRVHDRLCITRHVPLGQSNPGLRYASKLSHTAAYPEQPIRLMTTFSHSKPKSAKGMRNLPSQPTMRPFILQSREGVTGMSFRVVYRLPMSLTFYIGQAVRIEVGASGMDGWNVAQVALKFRALQQSDGRYVSTSRAAGERLCS